MIFFKNNAHVFSLIGMFFFFAVPACSADDVFVSPLHPEITKQQIDRLIEDVVPLIETLEKQVVLSQKNNYGKDSVALLMTIISTFFVSLIASDNLADKIMKYYSLYEYQAITQENLKLSHQFRTNVLYCLLPLCAGIISSVLYQLMLRKPYLNQKEMVGSIKNLQKLKMLIDQEISNEQQLNQLLQDITPLTKGLQRQVNLGEKINYEHFGKHVIALSSAAVAGICGWILLGAFLQQVAPRFCVKMSNPSSDEEKAFVVFYVFAALIGQGSLVYLVLYQLLLKKSSTSKEEALALIKNIEALKERLNALKYEPAQVVLGGAGSPDGLSYDLK